MGETEKPSSDCMILVVDDDNSIGDLLKLILEMDGYNIKLASNGRDALDCLPTMHRPCMILLDLMMPEMNGWEFYEAIKDNPSLKDIPIVVTTAFSQVEIKMPHAEILQKPL